MSLSLLAVAALSIAAGSAHASFIQPDDAVASSQFSLSYDILQTIDGSGFIDPMNITPDQAHDIYKVGNHWTTSSNPTLPTTATFFFDADQTLGTFYMWNHQANGAVDGLAAGSSYDVTDFTLTLRDASNNVLYTFTTCAAIDIATAQVFPFDQVYEGVRSVDFQINSYLGGNFTGLAEVGFDTDVVPLPALSPCDSDLDASGVVDLPDLLELLGSFGTCGPTPDFNNSGLVDLADLLFLLSNFGTVCP